MASVAEKILRVKADKRSIADASKAVASVDDRMAALTKTAERNADAFAKTGKNMRDAFSGQSKQIDQARQAQARMNQELDRARAAVERYDAAYKDVSDRVSVYGDVDTGLMTSAGLLGTIGGQGAQPLVGGVQIAGEFAAVAEALPRTAVGLKELATRARESSPLIQGMANQIGGQLGQSLSKGKAGIAAVAGAGAIAGVALAGAAFAIGEASKQAQREAEALKSSIEASASVERQIADGLTTEEAEQRIQELQGQLETEQRILQRRRDGYDAFEQQIADEFGIFGGLAETALRAFDPREQALSDSIREAEGTVTGLRAEISNLQSALDDGRTATNDVAAAHQDAADQIASAEDDLAKAQQRYVTVMSDLSSQLLTTTQNYAQQQTQLLEDRALRDQREQEDYELQLKDHNERLYELRAESNKRIEDLQADSGKALVTAERKAGDARIKAIDDLADAETKLRTDFNKDSLKAQAQYNKARRRAEDDLANTILDAVIANDILQLTQAQRRGETEAERRDEDFADEQAERTAQRDERLAELREENRLRLEEIKTGLTEERAQIQANLVERIALEEAAQTERIKQEREAQADRDAQRQLRLQREDEDDALADRRRDEAHKREIARINARIEAEQLAYRQAERALSDLRSGSEALSNTARGFLAMTAGSRSRPASSSSQNSGGVGNLFGSGNSGGIQLFADGGIVPAGIAGLGAFEPNRNFAEAVIPLRPNILSQLIPQAAGPQISYGNITINGDGVTVDEVRAAFREFAMTQNRVVQSALRGAG